jgi:ornithine racemase
VKTPRLEIDLDKIFHNATTLVRRLRSRGIGVTGITKACLGDPKFAETLLAAGVSGLGDSRIENIDRMRRAGIAAHITLIRSPMLSQTDQVVEMADASHNSELDVIEALSRSAVKLGRRHAVVLMVELGDLREGIMPVDLETIARRTMSFPQIDLCGIGTNLACFNGATPDSVNMGKLSRLADFLDRIFCSTAGSLGRVVSGGNSSNLHWAFNENGIGRINNLRLGESILMGADPLHDAPIEGLYTDAVTLFAEVIEAKIKPRQPWGTLAHSTFARPHRSSHQGTDVQLIVALGQQDIDPDGLIAPRGFQVMGASSDHLIVRTAEHSTGTGSEIPFHLNYSALLRAATSPFVTKRYRERDSASILRSQFQEYHESGPA